MKWKNILPSARGVGNSCMGTYIVPILPTWLIPSLFLLGSLMPCSSVLCYLVALFPCFLFALFPCYSVSLLPCYSVSLLLCFIVTLLVCYLVTLLLCYLVTLSPCYPVVTLLLCYLVTLLPCLFFVFVVDVKIILLIINSQCFSGSEWIKSPD